MTWLSVSPPSGFIAQGGSEAVTLHFDAAGLAAGDYTAYVVVTHNGATSPDAIPVDLAVTDPSPAGETPLVFGLRGAYPNPFNPRTHIAFTLGEAGPVALQVLDLRGRVVKTVVRSELAAGEHDVVWDGTDDSGRHVAAGTYLARLQTRTQSATSKMVLAK